MTNTWQDIKNANVVVVMGGNAAEAHPCGFKWVIEAKIENGAKLVVIDPRFTRTASVADYYAPIRPGTDIAFLSGVMHYLLEKDAIQHEYVRAYTNASLIVKDGFAFNEGLFSGYNEETHAYDRSSWDYELDEQGFAKSDDTWQNPRCVINLLKQHVSRYTPEMVSRICGTPQDKFLHICGLIAGTSAPDKAMTSLFALGWTQHSVGAQNIRTMAMIQLLLGNIGVSGGGIGTHRRGDIAQRGHTQFVRHHLHGLGQVQRAEIVHAWDAYHRMAAREFLVLQAGALVAEYQRFMRRRRQCRYRPALDRKSVV